MKKTLAVSIFILLMAFNLNASANPFSSNSGDYAIKIDAENAIDGKGVPFTLYGKLNGVTYSELGLMESVSLPFGDQMVDMELTEENQRAALLISYISETQGPPGWLTPRKDALCSEYAGVENGIQCVTYILAPLTAIFGNPTSLIGLSVDEIIGLFEPESGLTFEFLMRDKDGNMSPSQTLRALHDNYSDGDDDGVLDIFDNCVEDSNPDQVDTDSDGIGDVCGEADNDPDDTNPASALDIPAGSLMNDGGSCSFIANVTHAETGTILLMLGLFVITLGYGLFARKRQ